MNVIFHISVGAGIISSMSHLNIDKNITKISLSGFLLGVISHGVLDYTPHCYPINSKVDVIVGLVLILLSVFFTKRSYLYLVLSVYLGCIFPDIIDLLPSIINSQLGTNLPILNKIFPWHLHKYSGSIYNDECNVSTINHILALLFSFICIVLNKKSLKKILGTTKNK